MTELVYEYQTINKLDYNEFIKEVVHAVHSDGWERYGEPQDLITTMGTLYNQELRRDITVEMSDPAPEEIIDPYRYLTIEGEDLASLLRKQYMLTESTDWEESSDIEEVHSSEGQQSFRQTLRRLNENGESVAPMGIRDIKEDRLEDLDGVTDETPDYINPHKFLRRPTDDGAVSREYVEENKKKDINDVLNKMEDEYNKDPIGYHQPESDEMEDNDNPPEEDGTSKVTTVPTSLKYYVVTGLDVHAIGERINQEVRKGWKVDGDLIVTRLTDDSVKYTQRLVK